MKLNKNGWSLKEMVILSSILFAFLLIAIFNIVRMYYGLHKEDDHSSTNQNTSEVGYTYQEIENNVLEAGIDYYNLYYNLESDIKITIYKMKKLGVLDSNLLKPNGETKECTGYVQFKNGDPKAFIQCANYKTNGYEE